MHRIALQLLERKLIVVRQLGGRKIINVDLLEVLGDDHHVHPPEDAVENDEASDALGDQGDILTEVYVVQALNEDAESHVKHAKNDRHFHFDRIGLHEPVGCDRPNRVLAYRVDAERVLTAVDGLALAGYNADLAIWRQRCDPLRRQTGLLVEVVAAAEEIGGNGEPLVVDESTISRHRAHQKKQIAGFRESL